MPLYKWKAKTRRNQVRRGKISAPDEAAARMQLLRMQMTPIWVRPKTAPRLKSISGLQPRVRPREIVVFSRQLATMIDAGLPLIRCLEILKDQQRNPAFAKVLQQVREAVEGGATLSEAFGRFPKLFDRFFVNMVAAGEAAGVLDVMLERLCGHLEKNARLKSRLWSALTYPLITIVIALAVLMVMLVFVIPVFQQMYAHYGNQLPLPTRMVIAVSHGLKANLLILAVGTLLLAFGFRRIYRSPRGREFCDRWVLKIPLIGRVLTQAAAAKVTHTLGMMLASGITILKALDIVAASAGNRHIEQAVLRLRAQVAGGETLAAPLIDSGIFPAMVGQMVAVGESTGALDSMLDKVAGFFSDEVDQAVAQFSALLEPMLMVVLGIVIGTIVVAMYLPMFRMAAIIG